MTDFNQKTHDTDVGSHGGQSRQMMEVFENQEFGSIRLLQEAGKTFFCASDVAKALGYVNPYAAVKRHCRDPLTKREGVVQKVNQYGDAGEQVVEISFITEGDVYRLIVHSKLPSAERFEHWVFDEVLPSIRKHGAYMSDSILDQVIQHPEVIYTLAQELVAEREQLEGIRKQLDAAQPKADYIESGVMNDTKLGTMQGGILSPLLSNVYLNDFDWFVGRMYMEPHRQCKHKCNDTRRLKWSGVTPKYNFRFADDWVILTSTEQEAYRLWDSYHWRACCNIG